MKLTTGVDIIEIQRFAGAIERHGARFLERVYTPLELAELGKNTASLAGRFAAKEAVSKALGTGIGAVRWQDIEVLHGPSREPLLHLHGEAQQRAGDLGLHTWSISLSHSDDYAVAFVVATGDDR